METEDDVKPRTRGLGRGLNALFEDDESPVTPPEDRLDESSGQQESRKQIGIERLQPGSLQPRRHFDQEALQQLADSISAHGLLQPILVRPDKLNDECYEILAGERRWRAAQLAQLHEVPVIILQMSDVEALEVALIENLQREDLNPVEEARGYQKLLQDYGHTQEKLAQALGKSRPYIANMVRLLNLPESVLKQVEDGSLSAGHARALITAQDPESLAQEIIREGLSVRQAEQLAAYAAGRSSEQPGSKDESSATAASSKAKTPGGKKPVPKDADTRALEEDLSAALGMRVSIESADGQSGKISVEFKNLDQLDEILHRLSHYPAKRLTG